MPDNRSDPRPEPRSKRWFVALSVVAAILLALGVAVTLTVAGRRVPQARTVWTTLRASQDLLWWEPFGRWSSGFLLLLHFRRQSP